VPIVVLDVLSPIDGTNILPGIVGMNTMAGRNLVINPKAGSVAAGLYISDPVTIEKNWTTTAASGVWSAASSWNDGTTPTNLGIANVRHVSGGNQTSVLSASTTVWEVNVSGTANQTMTLQVQSGATLQTFSGINIELGGAIQLQNGTLDAQFVEMLGGSLSGQGTITTGSGPIAGQVENRGGTVAPGNGVGELAITGRFANGPNGTVAVELAGNAMGQYDKLTVTGGSSLEGTLAVSLLGGFAPTAGSVFTILTTTEDIGGAFNNLLAPDGFNWRANYNANNLQLVVGNPGDFNFDGSVNAADYVVWRNNSLGPLNFAAWRSHFGVTYGSGAGLDNSAGVPEPGTIALVGLAACGLAFRRRCATRRVRSAA
jgi:hypothetical protein